MASDDAAAAVAAGGGRPEKSRDMRLTIQEAAKKLSLWHNATFRPILTHDDLEPILAAAGFVALPPPEPPKDQEGAAVAWREYAFLGVGGGVGNAVAGCVGPRPRLPYPRVDALHLRTYQAFLGAVEVYLGALRVPNLFHVRCMPVTAPHDRMFDKVFRAMRNDQDSIIVYRDGTLDGAAFTLCSEHTPMEDVGYHVIPGNTCSDLGYLRLGKIDGNCDEEICKRYPDYIDVVRLKDLFPNPSRKLSV